MNSYDHQHSSLRPGCGSTRNRSSRDMAFEFDPNRRQKLRTAEWAARTPGGMQPRRLLERFELDPSKCWQMIFQGLCTAGSTATATNTTKSSASCLPSLRSAAQPFRAYLGEASPSRSIAGVRTTLTASMQRTSSPTTRPPASSISWPKDGYEITTDDTIELEDLLLGNCDICVSVCKNLVDIEPLVKETLYP